MQTVNEAYFTPKEIAERLRVSESTVRRWLDSGALRGLRLPGRGWRISQTAVEEFFERQAAEAKE